MDIQYYPFDEQTCKITYYVSDETIATIALNHDPDLSMEEFTENSAWKVMAVSKRTYLKQNAHFIDIKFHVQRRAGFTTFTLIMPLLMLAFLNICIFLVPIGSGEKGSFAITIFLAYGIFVSIVSDTLPHNSLHVSYFVLLITVLLFVSVLSVFYTVVQAKLVALFGNNECTWKCLRPHARKNNRVEPLARGVEDIDTGRVADTYTWMMMFQRLDTIMFGIFFALILLCISVFFCLMLGRVDVSSVTHM